MSARFASLAVLATCALVAATLPQGNIARASTDCGAKSISGSFPAPAPGKGFKVELVINDDCSVARGAPQEMTDQEIDAANHDNSNNRTAESRQSFARIGSTRQRLDPDYHMDTHLWDCCNALLSHLVTDLSWTDDGSVITGWNSGGYTGQHPEFGTCGPGWQLANSYLIQYSGGTGQSSIIVKSHAEWSYLGIFDCSGTAYYNVFEHFVYGYGSGASDCGYTYSLRKTFQGFHLQVQCYNPTITLVDNNY